jgi:hypothetical protein
MQSCKPDPNQALKPDPNQALTNQAHNRALRKPGPNQASCILIGLLAISAFSTVGDCAQHVQRQFLASADPRPKDASQQTEYTVVLSGIQFTFPPGYLAQRSKELFSIITLWPQMGPRTSGRPSPRSDRIEILVTSRPGHDTANAGLEAEKRRGLVTKRLLPNLGLIEFRGALDWYQAADPAVTTPGGSPLAFACQSPYKGDNEEERECEATYRYTDDLWVIYRFKRKHMRDWRAIDQAVLGLLNSHIVEK